MKGLTEIGVVGTAAAVANAIFHATAKRVRNFPITLDKLLLHESERVFGSLDLRPKRLPAEGLFLLVAAARQKELHPERVICT